MYPNTTIVKLLTPTWNNRIFPSFHHTPKAHLFLARERMSRICDLFSLFRRNRRLQEKRKKENVARSSSSNRGCFIINQVRTDLSDRLSCSPSTPRTRSGRRRAHSIPTWNSTGSRSSRRTQRATRRSGGTGRRTGGPGAPDRQGGG